MWFYSLVFGCVVLSIVQSVQAEGVWENFEDVCYYDKTFHRSSTVNKRCEGVPNVIVEKRYFKNNYQYCTDENKNSDTSAILLDDKLKKEHVHVPVAFLKLNRQEIRTSILQNRLDPLRLLHLNSSFIYTSYREWTNQEITHQITLTNETVLWMYFSGNTLINCDIIMKSMHESYHLTLESWSKLKIVFETKRQTDFRKSFPMKYLIVNQNETCIVNVTIQTVDTGKYSEIVIYQGPLISSFEYTISTIENNYLKSFKVNGTESCDPFLADVPDIVFDNQRNKNPLNFYEKCVELNAVRAEPEPNYCENLPEVNVRLLYLNEFIKFWCVTIDRSFAVNKLENSSSPFAVDIKMSGHNNFVRWSNESNSIVESVRNRYVFNVSQRIVVSIEPINDITDVDDVVSIKINELESCGLVLMNSVCGIQKIKHRTFITNGFPTFPGQYPWHVAIYQKKDNLKKKYACGGSIIGSNIVLTAAHCVVKASGKINADRLSFEVGRFDLRFSGKFTVEYEVLKSIPHEDYDIEFFEHDIAILKSKIFIDFNDFVQPVCLTSNEEPFYNKLGNVPGWGTDELDNRENVLSDASLPVVDNWDCRASNRDFFQNFLFDGKFCAGHRNGTSVCTGDSGGGLVVKFPSRWFIKGIASVGLVESGMCDGNQYALFTDVVYYNKWILSHIKS